MKWNKKLTIAELAKLNNVGYDQMKYLVNKYDMGYKGKVLPPEWVPDTCVEFSEDSHLEVMGWDEVSVCL